MSRTLRTLTAGLLTFVALAGCSSKPPTAPPPSPIPAPSPIPQPPVSFPAPVITGLSESLGSTGGGALVIITGSGFLRAEGGAVVLFGGVHSSEVSHLGTTTIYATAPAHPAGLVDVVVTNPDGQSARVADAFTYASPASFDPNGEWEGGAYYGHVDFRFTVQNGRLTAISCDTSGTVNLSPAPAVNNGEFAYSGEHGVAIAGRQVSPAFAIGTVSLGPCINADWFARKAH